MSRRPPDPDEAAVLHARARQLAQRTGTPAAEAMLEVLVFRLADEQYAIETRQIDEVLSLRDLTPLPGTPAFVRGVLNRRGTILAVFDIKRLLGLPEHGLTDLHQVAVVSGNDMTIGLLVDTVVDVQMLPEGRLQRPAADAGDGRDDYLRGVTAERLALLDVERILADPMLIVNDQGEG
jgi:purine-binding chemotaxis protein CheW